MKFALRSFGLFIVTATVVGVLGAQACGCSSGTVGNGSASPSPLGQFIADAGACAKAEAAAVASSTSVLDVATDVAALVSSARSGDTNTIEAAIGALIVKFGEPIVACAVVRGEANAGDGSGSGGALRSGNADTAIRRELARRHGWQPAAQ